MIIFNLACGDFCVSIFGNPWTFISALNRRWIFGQLLCKMYGFLMSLLGKRPKTRIQPISHSIPCTNRRNRIDNHPNSVGLPEVHDDETPFQDAVFESSLFLRSDFGHMVLRVAINGASLNWMGKLR